MTPRRVQVQGDLFHGHVPAGAVYVGRPAPGLAGSRWANPFKVGKPTPVTVRFGGRVWTIGAQLANRWPPDRHAAVDWYRSLVGHTGLHDEIVADLAGKDLACWCAESAPCHADVLLEISNGVEAVA